MYFISGIQKIYCKLRMLGKIKRHLMNQNEYVTTAVNSNLTNYKIARKKVFFLGGGGFNGIVPVASALALQCSPS